MSYTDVVRSVPGLTHYYPLTTDANDVQGTANGVNHGATFSNGKAVFDGSSYIEIASRPEFEATGSGAMTVVVFMAVDQWTRSPNAEYVHWMGKGETGQHSWTFRHYVKGGTGEASTRHDRTSFYAYNAAGGLGAGSYVQHDTYPTTERMIVGTVDRVNIGIGDDGTISMVKPLSGYSIVQTYTQAPVRIGTRDKASGYLIGKVRRVAFYNRILTAQEIASLYAARDQSDDVTPTPDPTPTPVPDPTPTPDPEPQYNTYTVRKGDNLTKIGKKFGVTVDWLKAANSLTSDTIYPGQVLWVPKP